MQHFLWKNMKLFIIVFIKLKALKKLPDYKFLSPGSFLFYKPTDSPGFTTFTEILYSAANFFKPSGFCEITGQVL